MLQPPKRLNALDARPPTVRYNPPKPLDALAAAAAQLEQLAPSKDAPHVRPGDAQIEPKPHGAPPSQLDANPTLPSAGQHGTQQLGCPRWVANSARPPVSYHQVMPHHSKATGVPVKARPMLKPLVVDDNMQNTSHTSADHGADYGTEEAELAAEDHHDDAVGGNAAAAADDDEHEGRYSLMSCICPYIIHHHLLVTAIILVTHMPSQVLVQLSLWSWPQQSEDIHICV